MIITIIIIFPKPAFLIDLAQLTVNMSKMYSKEHFNREYFYLP